MKMHYPFKGLFIVPDVGSASFAQRLYICPRECAKPICSRRQRKMELHAWGKKKQQISCIA